jgi:hypothetical protein
MLRSLSGNIKAARRYQEAFDVILPTNQLFGDAEGMSMAGPSRWQSGFLRIDHTQHSGKGSFIGEPCGKA